MNNTQENQMICSNCYYYSQHYSKQGTAYCEVYYGHCTHPNVRNYKIRPLELCQNWKSIEIKKEERKRSVEEAIINMSHRLDELTLILKDDIDN